MKKHICIICDYVYDPFEGDPDNGISAGTPFDGAEGLPDTWECPTCGSAKEFFEEVDD